MAGRRGRRKYGSSASGRWKRPRPGVNQKVIILMAVVIVLGLMLVLLLNGLPTMNDMLGAKVLRNSKGEPRTVQQGIDKVYREHNSK